MQNQFQPEENQPPQTVSLAALQTSRAAETEAETQAAQNITARLEDIILRAARAKRRFWQGYILGSACLVFAPIVMIAIMWYFMVNPLLIMPPLYFGGFGIIILSVFNLSRKSAQFDADELARIGGVRAIPALMALLNTPFQMKRKQASFAALNLLLPQMRASDAPLLTPALRRYLNGCLANANAGGLPAAQYDSFYVAILKALEQVGDSSAIPAVTRLSQLRGNSRRSRRLREAAIECLPMLRANCGEVETARTLLRASHAEDARPDTLLRPASGAAPTAAQDLLRGAEPPDNNAAGQ